MAAPIDLPSAAGVPHALIERRSHGRRVLDEVAARFEGIGSGALDPPVLVGMIAALERELRWLLDELDQLDEEAAARSSP